MTHELTERADGRVEMAFRGETPWHGLGNELRDDMTLDERIHAAGFDWEIQKADVRFSVASGEKGKPPKSFKVDGKKILHRSDNQLALSIVSNGFQVTQPRQVLEYFDMLTEKFGFGTLETAGTMFEGRQFWGLATVGDTTSVILDKKDQVRMRILFATSCDRSLPNIIKFVCERVVCRNTLDVALREGGAEYRSRHRTAFSPDVANAALGIRAKEEFAGQLAILRKAATIPMTEAERVKASMLVYGRAASMRRKGPPVQEMTAEELRKTARIKQVRKVSQLAISHDSIGDNLKGSHGTLWGWMNAVTEYVDWDNGSKTPDRRMFRAWNQRMGAGVKTAAYNVAAEAVSEAKPFPAYQGKWALPDEELLELATTGKDGPELPC